MTGWLLWPPLAALVVYSAFSAFKYTRMISNIFMGLVYKPSWMPAAFSGGDTVTILDSSDREIRALLVENKERCENLVIFCHESGATKESWEKYAAFFPGRGYRVLSVDLMKKTAAPKIPCPSGRPRRTSSGC